MKIAIIMGSPRKKDSFNLCKEIEANLKGQCSELEFDYIFLSEYNIEDCKGCMMCFQKSEADCPCKDDLCELKKRLFSADGLIIASPVYAYQVPAQLKRFIDRMSYLYHRQVMVGKPALIAVTTDGGGSKQVYKYLKMTLSGWGLNVIGNIQIISPTYFKNRLPKSAFGYDEYYHNKCAKHALSMSNLFYKQLVSAKKKKPTFYDIFMFNCLRSKTYTSKADWNYWQDKGWLTSDYFYPVTINPLKKIFGKAMKGIIHTMGAKYLE